MISEQPRPEPSNPRSVWAGLVREHPGLLLTAGYLLLTAVGLGYELWFFRYFGINILEYVETSDFLLAALRTPLVVVLAVLPVLLVWILLRGNQWLHRRFPRYASFDNRWQLKPAARSGMWALLILLYANFFIQKYAERATGQIKAGQGREVQVELTSGTPLPSRALLLGTTSKFVFLYLPAEKKTHVIPIESLARLVVSSEKKRSSG